MIMEYFLHHCPSVSINVNKHLIVCICIVCIIVNNFMNQYSCYVFINIRLAHPQHKYTYVMIT